MIPNTLLIGKTVALEEMLNAREYRQYLQQTLIQQYQQPLISFTLNIVGPLKVFPLVMQAYQEGLSSIRNHCKANGLSILHFEEIRKNTGYEGFFVVPCHPIKLKKIISQLEQTSSLGRLFDIDIIKLDGTKVSRTEIQLPERTCLLCNKNAFECSRSRAHSVEELINREIQIMWDYFSFQYAKQVSSIATRALLYEVDATPKPGLVDSNNTGSHKDMNIFTFEKSAIALTPYFLEFVQCGIHHCNSPLSDVFALIRPIGMKAEIDMLRATNGVNTHKGIIFSLGIICTCLGIMYGKQIPFSEKELQTIGREMVKELALDFKDLTSESATTNGEVLYVQYGIRGIRGEALDGYPNIFSLALPTLKMYIAQNYSLNDAGISTLLHILANTEDTNIISRSSYETLKEIQEKLQAFIHAPTKNYSSYIENLDQTFIALNISPGGSADLLALTYFLYFYEEEMGETYGF